jgi:hypothetical protein
MHIAGIRNSMVNCSSKKTIESIKEKSVDSSLERIPKINLDFRIMKSITGSEMKSSKLPKL